MYINRLVTKIGPAAFSLRCIELHGNRATTVPERGVVDTVSSGMRSLVGGVIRYGISKQMCSRSLFFNNVVLNPSPMPKQLYS